MSDKPYIPATKDSLLRLPTSKFAHVHSDRGAFVDQAARAAESYEQSIEEFADVQERSTSSAFSRAGFKRQYFAKDGEIQSILETVAQSPTAMTVAAINKACFGAADVRAHRSDGMVGTLIRDGVLSLASDKAQRFDRSDPHRSQPRYEVNPRMVAQPKYARFARAVFAASSYGDRQGMNEGADLFAKGLIK